MKSRAPLFLPVQKVRGQALNWRAGRAARKHVGRGAGARGDAVRHPPLPSHLSPPVLTPLIDWARPRPPPWPWRQSCTCQ